jgi:isoleucyl-tRNA synthetase
MPFLADELYQNLVRGVDEAAPESVHLADWPAYDASLIDESLNRSMDLVIKLVSLGHAARQKANRKVRQPLQEAAFSLGNSSERQAVLEFSELIEDELNVKHVRLLDSATEAVSHSVKPLPKQLGQKYGSKFPAVQKAILALDSEATARTLLEGKSLRVAVDGVSFEIESGDVEVKAQARGGFAIAEEGAYVVALETTLTPELVREGQAREFVRRVQELRKSSGLDVADRIRLFVESTVEIQAAVEAHQDYVMAETLCVAVEFSAPPADASRTNETLDSQPLLVGLLKAD